MRLHEVLHHEHAPGALDAITDVSGVRVGHTTVSAGSLQTGVTAVLPPALPTPAGLFVGNGHGKLVGATQLTELGTLETPILLTGTLSTFRVADALVSWLMEHDPSLRSVNPVVGECNDGWLSDIRARPVTAEHVYGALTDASTGPVAQGNVGAGTGMCALGFKGGIGTASRRAGDVTVGVLVQSNFDGRLRFGPRYVDPPAPEPVARAGNSCMILVATDAALDARQLCRVARRAVFGLARVGAGFTHGSGDYAIAFSTGPGPQIADADLSPLFAATMEATEAAVLKSLLAAETMTGFRGRTVRALTDAHPDLMDELSIHTAAL
ncbi:D-aminopeptidase [Branchiibius hedensis]|uniref:D-aminopeptidase n=1 Tax=Branchiibius hedensis TaxID=672460 RepID=A0A2Y8ZU31_9MICO|nr:P1 family peptidase [Branchiibius hedensis]PWJ25965.1 D-aminopeptidase [Branchiibius hedensis]SSA34778.1 D-aminopeptidase [Branchiibius hedensis]